MNASVFGQFSSQTRNQSEIWFSSVSNSMSGLYIMDWMNKQNKKDWIKMIFFLIDYFSYQHSPINLIKKKMGVSYEYF